MEESSLLRVRLNRLKHVGIALLIAMPVVGCCGEMFGMLHSYRAIESNLAPTPEQLAVGVYITTYTWVGAFVLGVVGLALLFTALIRLCTLDRARKAETPAA